jgi:hypothetical protein
MIKIKYHGKLGNSLLQYGFAKILSLELGQYLPPHKIDFIPYTNQEFNFGNKNEWDNSIIVLKGQNKYSVDKIKIEMEKNGIRNIFLRDSCANYSNFLKYKRQIREEWFLINQPYNKENLRNNKSFFVRSNETMIPHSVEKIEDNDMVVNVRLGDIETKHRDRLLDIEYFKIILNNVKYNRLFIAAEDTNSLLLRPFDQYSPIYFVQNHYMDSFNFVRLFSRIVISQSSFCWWASYLSDAKEIYYPIVRNGPWIVPSRNNEDLRVNEERYIYVSQKNAKILGRYEEIKKWE